MSNTIQTQIYSVGQTFGIPGAENIQMTSHAPCGNPYVPQTNANYKFRKDLLRNILMYLQAPCGDALYLSGPTGSGKTSAITEIAARLNWPVQSITAHGRLEFQDLIGHHTLVSEKPGEPATMKWVYGPLAKAMALGHIFILNEIDLMDPSELSGLNDLLEGRPLVIEQNGGKVIKPHPLFRFVATGNTRGSGDESGIYAGTVCQNVAAMDRYRMLIVDYPERDVERAILAAEVPQIPEDLRDKMIKIANEIRKKFLSEDRELNVTLSTRKLVQWGKLWTQCYGAPSPAQMSLDIALLNRCQTGEREAIDRLCELEFGSAVWTPRPNL